MSALDEVQALLQAWAGAYATKDADALMEIFAPGDDLVLVGTGVDEIRFGREAARAQAERDMAQADSLEARFDHVRVAEKGDAAFAYCDTVVAGTVGGQPFESGALRCTLGLVKVDGRWRAQQLHLSAPAAGQEAGSSF